MNRTLGVMAVAAAAVGGAMAAISAIMVLPLGPAEAPAAPVTTLAQVAPASGAPGSAAPAATAKAEAPAKTVRVTLGSYNIENFFDRYDDPYNGDEVMAPKEEASLAKAAEVLKATNADFTGIVEMENMGALARFVNKRMPDAGYKFVYVNQTIDLRGINNGFISRLRPESMTVYRFNELTMGGADRTWPFARDLLQVTLRPGDDDTRVTVFVVHLKSKRDGPGDPDSVKWRSAETHALRTIIWQMLQRDPQALIAVVGDFNDTPESKPIAALTGDEEHSAVLVDVTANVPADERITYLREPYRSQIDYVMASPALAKCYVAGSAKVVKVDGMMEASDHAPVVAAFDIPVR